MLRLVLLLTLVSFSHQLIDFNLCAPLPLGTKIEDVSISVAKCDPTCLVPRMGSLELQFTTGFTPLNISSSGLSVTSAVGASVQIFTKPGVIGAGTLGDKFSVKPLGNDKYRVVIRTELAVPNMFDRRGKIVWILKKGKDFSFCIETPVLVKIKR